MARKCAAISEPPEHKNVASESDGIKCIKGQMTLCLRGGKEALPIETVRETVQQATAAEERLIKSHLPERLKCVILDQMADLRCTVLSHHPNYIRAKYALQLAERDLERTMEAKRRQDEDLEMTASTLSAAMSGKRDRAGVTQMRISLTANFGKVSIHEQETMPPTPKELAQVQLRIDSVLLRLAKNSEGAVRPQKAICDNGRLCMSVMICGGKTCLPLSQVIRASTHTTSVEKGLLSSQIKPTIVFDILNEMADLRKTVCVYHEGMKDNDKRAVELQRTIQRTSLQMANEKTSHDKAMKAIEILLRQLAWERSQPGKERQTVRKEERQFIESAWALKV